MNHSPQRGLSLVELLVGLAIGLWIVGGAIGLFVNQLQTSRLLLLEARLAQDLRTAADTIVRDLRRASHWKDAPSEGGLANPHGTIVLEDATPLTGGAFQRIRYSMDLPTSGSGQAVVFAKNGGKLTLQLGGSGAQELTDPAVVRITRLAITPHTTTVALASGCADLCAATTSCPTLAVRSYDIELTAQATADPSLVREIRNTVVVRNDHWEDTCSGG